MAVQIAFYDDVSTDGVQQQITLADQMLLITQLQLIISRLAHIHVAHCILNQSGVEWTMSSRYCTRLLDAQDDDDDDGTDRLLTVKRFDYLGIINAHPWPPAIRSAFSGRRWGN